MTKRETKRAKVLRKKKNDFTKDTDDRRRGGTKREGAGVARSGSAWDRTFREPRARKIAGETHPLHRFVDHVGVAHVLHALADLRPAVRGGEMKEAGSARVARFPRDDRVSVGTRTGPKKNCKDWTSAVAGDEAQSRDCRQASCLVTFAFTRGSHLQPPAVVVLFGLIKACLDLAGVRELMSASLCARNSEEGCVRNCFTNFLPKSVVVRQASSFGATRVPRAADVDRDGVGGSVTVPGVGTRGVPTPSPGVSRVATRPGAPRDRRCACLAVSAISRRVLRVRGPRRRPSSASHRLTLFVSR